jgi:hypothetical protein
VLDEPGGFVANAQVAYEFERGTVVLDWSAGAWPGTSAQPQFGRLKIVPLMTRYG